MANKTIATKDVPSTVVEMIQDVDSCLAIQLATRSSRSFLSRDSRDHSFSPSHSRMDLVALNWNPRLGAPTIGVAPIV